MQIDCAEMISDAAGINRLPTVVAGYLMQSRSLSANSACVSTGGRRSPGVSLLEEFSDSLKGGS